MLAIKKKTFFQETMNIIHIQNCSSTNIYLKELAQQEKLEEGIVVSTTRQTAGRGQQNNSWESEDGKNITFSMLLCPDFLPLNQFFLLSEAISLGIKDTLSNYTENISIKWPNDIYYKDQKVCGILIENELNGNRFSQSVVGIGLNVNQELFTSNAPNPVSLKQITGENFDLVILLDEVLRNCLNWYEKLKQGQIQIIENSYFNSLYWNKDLHSYKDSSGIFQATIEKVAPDGHLHLRIENGESRSYAFKEVEFYRKEQQ